MVLAGAAVAALAAPAAADAAGAWHPTYTVVGAGSPGTPAVSLPRLDDALLGWTRHVPRKGYAVLVSERRAARGAWLRPVRLSGLVPRRPLLLQLAGNRTGAAVAVWVQADGTLRSAVREVRAGSWRHLAVAHPPAGAVETAGLRVAVDQEGRAWAAWLVRDATGWRARLATRRAGGAWLAVTDLAIGAQAAPPPWGETPPSLAVGARGGAAVAWTDPIGSVRVAQALDPVGGWQPPVTLSPAGSDPSAAVGPAGHAAVTWASDPLGGGEVQARLRAPGDPDWGPAETVSPLGGFPHVAVGPQGEAVATWAVLGIDRLAPEGSRRPPGGSWEAAQTIYDRFAFTDAVLALREAQVLAGPAGGDAEALALWRDPEGPGTESGYGAALRAGRWTAPRILVASERVPALSAALTPGGQALVAGQQQSFGSRIQIAHYDALAPIRLRLTVRSPRRVPSGRRFAIAFRVANIGRVDAHGVLLRTRLPTRFRVVSATGQPRRAGPTLSWSLRTLRAGRAASVRAVLVAPPGRHAVAASVQAVSTAPETAYTAVTAVRVPHRG
jgi:hypothetical protein